MILPGWAAAAAILGAVELEQVQPAGVDLRVWEVEVFEEEGVLGVGARHRPRGRGLEPNGEGWWVLGPGSYRVRFLDAVQVPSGAVGLCFPRSSLLRMGALLACAVWDPGYRGRGEALLVVHNPHGIRLQRGARVAQLVFLPVSQPVAGLYDGLYQGEGLSGTP